MKKHLTLITLLIASIAVYGQKVTLALNLTQGDTYPMSTTAKMLMTQDINGQAQEINMNIISRMTFKVTGIKDTTYLMDVKFDRVAMQMTIGAQNVNFDSDSKTKDMPSILMGNLTNKVFSIVMSKKGKILTVNNIDVLYASLFNGIPDITDAQKAQFKSMMMQSFGPESLKGNIELATALFPDNKVAKSDKWTVKTVLESTMKADVKTTFTLQDITDNAYLLHGDSQIVTDKNAVTEVNGMKVNYDLAGTSTYEIKLDKNTGWTTDAKITQNMKGNLAIKDNPQVPGGMTVPMTITDEQSITDK